MDEEPKPVDGADPNPATAGLGCPGDLADLKAQAEEFRHHVEHVQRLEVDVLRELERVRVRVDRMAEHLWAQPYVSDQEALRISGPNGTVGMGYAQPAGGQPDTARSYVEFESLFRGSRAFVNGRLAAYVDLVRSAAEVLDLGCGRGEFLELLRGSGVRAVGVDLDGGMVEEARRLGLEARVTDLFAELASRPDESVEAVFSAQVIEHLAPRDMQRMFDEIHRVLTPGGVGIVETVNPHSVRAFRFFWLDRSHSIPVYPESALLMARSAGFRAASIFFPGGSGDLADDLRDSGDFAVVCAKRADTLVQAGLLSA